MYPEYFVKIFKKSWATYLPLILYLPWLAACLLLFFVCFFATGSSTYIVTFVSHGYCITGDNRSHWRSHRTNEKIPADFGGLGFHVVCTITAPQQEEHYTSTLGGVSQHGGTQNQTRDFLACYLGQTQFEWVCPRMDFGMATLQITQLSVCSLLNLAIKQYLRSTILGHGIYFCDFSTVMSHVLRLYLQESLSSSHQKC